MEKDDALSSLIGSKILKGKTDEYDENELKQLETESAFMLSSLGTMDISINRDLGQLKDLLSKNLTKGAKEKRGVVEGNGRRLLASEKFNHGLIENQLMNLKQDLNIGAKVGTRKIYRAKRDFQDYEHSENDFENLVK